MDYGLYEGHNIANPTLTHTHGLLEDCGDTTGYSQVDSADPLTSPTLTVLRGDIFELRGTCDSAADEWVLWWKDFSGLSLSTNIYPNFLARWRTQGASDGLGARIEAWYSDASHDVLFGDPPAFNTNWNVTAGTLTTGKTLDKIYFIANDYPDSTASGTSSVYYDFLLLYNDTFTFPNVTERVQIQSVNRMVDIPIPGRVGDVTQYLGAESETIRIVGDMKIGSWGTPEANILYKLLHRSHSDIWNWFTCDDPKRNYKVTVRSFNPNYEGGRDGKPRYELVLKEYRRGGANYESWEERFGFI